MNYDLSFRPSPIRNGPACNATCLRTYHCRRWARHSLRSILDAIFYLLRTGCPWRFLPGKQLARWCEGYGGWEVEIVGRDPDTKGFAV